MLQVGTIGTSMVTEHFLQAAELTNLFKLRGVYSQTVEYAKDLATIYKAIYYTDELNNLLYDPEVDVVYIASLHALHYDHALRAVQAGKHVIIEKPMVASSEEWHRLHQLAERVGVFVFEAAEHIQNRNYHRLKQLVRNKIREADQPFFGANLNLGKYSSEYVRYLGNMDKDEPAPDVFNLELAGGTLMDIGIYPVYVAMDLFGTPQSVGYQVQKGPDGSDLFGHIMLAYGEYVVTIFVSKGVHSQLASEIYIDDETIVIEDITQIKQVDLINAQGQSSTIVSYRPESPMYDELVNFADVINNSKSQHHLLMYEDWKQLSLQVVQTLELLRRSAGIEIGEKK